MSRFINPFPRFTDDELNLLSSGTLVFKETGTNTLKQTYADPSLTVPHPLTGINLLGDGTAPAIYYSGQARVELLDENDVILNFADPVSSTIDTGQFSSYASTTTYNQNDIVRASDGLYYRSITNNNVNNDPIGSSVSWTQVIFIDKYNSNVTYSADALIVYSGLMYLSLQNDNVGNTPDQSAAYWTEITGTGSLFDGLSDPNGDRIPVWDESGNSAAWLEVGSGLEINSGALAVSGGNSSSGLVYYTSNTGASSSLSLTLPAGFYKIFCSISPIFASRDTSAGNTTNLSFRFQGTSVKTGYINHLLTTSSSSNLEMSENSAASMQMTELNAFAIFLPDNWPNSAGSGLAYKAEGFIEVTTGGTLTFGIATGGSNVNFNISSAAIRALSAQPLTVA